MLSKVLIFLQLFSDDEFSRLLKTYCNFWIVSASICSYFLPFEYDLRAPTPVNDTSICLWQKLHLAAFDIFFYRDLYLGFNNHSSLRVDLEYFYSFSKCFFK